MQLVPRQQLLRPALPVVLGCKDYHDRAQLLDRVDSVLHGSGLERLFLELSLQSWLARHCKAPTGKAIARFEDHSSRALRCSILKVLLGCSFRDLSTRLAESALCRHFCGQEDFAVVRVPSKSTLQRYERWLPAAEMSRVLDALTEAVRDANRARLIGLECELETETLWLDATCLKARVHFPCDWTLLRDAARTILKSVATIRRHGLVHRIGAPEEFMARMNALTMEMAATRRQSDSRKRRKKVLRHMKALSQQIEAHGRRYRQKLDEYWMESDLSRAEAEVILRRLDQVLSKLPEARRQAHERIIGERKVPSAQKMLSLYEDDIHVLVRGKSGAEVEFGNSLFVVETPEGYILDHELCREQSPGDARWLADRLKALQERSGGRLSGVVADRGYDSARVRAAIQEAGLFNGVSPRDPKEMKRKRDHEPGFVEAQTRRAQTEGRIGILKNVFLEGSPRSKGYEGRQMAVQWAVLAHNLWVLARQPWMEARALEPSARAA